MANRAWRVIFLLLTALAGCTPNHLPSTPIGQISTQNPQDSLAVTRDSAAADAVTVNELIFYGGASVSTFYPTVTMTITPPGIFANGTATQTFPIDVNGQAIAFVSSQTPGTSTVEATVGGVNAQASTTFTVAWPNQVVIQADSPFLMPLQGTFTGVTATLVRNAGKVSLGEYVTFTDSTAVDSTIGVFQNTTPSDLSGRVTAQYFVQDTSYHGIVFIIGRVMTPSGPVQGRTQIKIR
jgi:hypothetical protein